ncbi:MAG TPA: ABC transporter permease [Burkholderiales bacterium]|nr:ABC transporter permease [Burkholderiales bacterium]
MGAIRRGFINPFRNKARAVVVVALLSLVTGFLALMVQATFASREQIASMEGRVRTLIELREAGAFGTGGFGGDKPIGHDRFSTDTLETVRKIPSAANLARVDEYVYTPQVDPSKKNAYAMLIGLHPGAALRAIGEVDYENARIVAGRNFGADHENADVAIVGRLYAAQRLGIADPSDLARAEQHIVLNRRHFKVIGIYTTANDFGDNHVFIPINAFRSVFNPGKRLSKIFVTVDSVGNVERVVAELKKALFEEADVVTAPEAVSTARTTLGSMAVASAYAAILLFAIGAVLTVFVMVLSTRERIREIGTLKAIGASNREVALQFLAEAFAVSALAAVGALLLALPFAPLVSQVLGVPISFDRNVVMLILAGSAVFAALGCLYPVIHGVRLSPVDAMRGPV